VSASQQREIELFESSKSAMDIIMVNKKFDSGVSVQAKPLEVRRVLSLRCGIDQASAIEWVGA